MLRQLASRAAASSSSSSQLCSSLSASYQALGCCSTRAVATEASRGVRRGGASTDCDGRRSSSTPMMIASSSGRSSSFFAALDSSFVPSTSYSLVSSWGSLGAQMRRRAFSTESEPPAGTTGLNPLLRAPGPLPPPSASAGADVVPLASSSSSSSSPLPSLQNAPPPLLTAAQRQLRSRAVLKNIRISPKKLARFAKLVSGMHVEDALAQCSVARETKAAGLLRGVIASAAANARANHGSLRGGGNGGDGGNNDGSNNFRVAEAVVGRAPTPTRPWYHGKGRTGVRHLYRSHLTIELEATSKPPLTRYQKPLLERQGKGRPRRVATTTRRREAEEEVAAAEAAA